MARNESKSHTTFDGYPNRCTICGERALITKDYLTFETFVPENVPRTYHTACRKKARENP